MGKQGNLDVGTLGTAEEMDTILRKKKKKLTENLILNSEIPVTTLLKKY